MSLAGLTIIVQTAALDRVHYALMMAASAAALDAPTTIFFAIEGVEALRPSAWDDLLTAAGQAGPAYIDRLEAARVAHPEDLLSALGELDARIAVCDSGLAVAGVTLADLRSDLSIEVTGLADVLSEAATGRIVYV